MAWNSKVIWSEGMLLQPQHLQQHDRYLHTLLEMRVAHLQAYCWGVSALTIDEQQLVLGHISILSCTLILPDGTPLSLPQEDALPLPLAVPEDARNVLVMLALPSRRPGIDEVSERDEPYNFARHRSMDYEVRDSNGLDNSALMQVGKLRLRLALEPEVAQGYTSVGLVRIVERRADRRVVLDPDYCPPCLDVSAAPRLAALAEEVLGLLQQRGDGLAQRLSQPGSAGAAEIADFLLLQLINRNQAVMAHLTSMTGLHPHVLYRELVQLAGELATFTRSDKRTPGFPGYRHHQLDATFTPVIEALRSALSSVSAAQAVSLRLEERQFGIRVAVVPDPDLIVSASFVLAVNAQMAAELIRSGFPAKVKIGSVEKIRDLVNLQLAGIRLVPLAVAPRQLPFHAGFTYFELDKQGADWQSMLHSAGFALHVPNEFPGLQLEFWAIRPVA